MWDFIIASVAFDRPSCGIDVNTPSRDRIFPRGETYPRSVPILDCSVYVVPTNGRDVYLVGSIAAGRNNKKVFIEKGRAYRELIAESIVSKRPNPLQLW